jgi:hypothetical protein
LIPRFSFMVNSPKAPVAPGLSLSLSVHRRAPNRAQTVALVSWSFAPADQPGADDKSRPVAPHTGGPGRLDGLMRPQKKAPTDRGLKVTKGEAPSRRLLAGRKTHDARFRRSRQFHPSIGLAPPKYRGHSDVALSEEHTVTLILFYVAFMIGGDLAAYLLGLLVEYEWGKQASLLVFLALYFLFLRVSWVLAVWVTTPRVATSSAR